MYTVPPVANFKVFSFSMQTFFKKDNFFDTPIDGQSATDTCMLGFSNTTGENIDGFIVEPIREKLFQRENLTAGLDLVALNIQRGRDHGTGSGFMMNYGALILDCIRFHISLF